MTLLGLIVVFLALAFVAYLFGAKRIAGFSLGVVKVILAIFVALLILVLLFGNTLLP